MFVLCHCWPSCGILFVHFLNCYLCCYNCLSRYPEGSMEPCWYGVWFKTNKFWVITNINYDNNSGHIIWIPFSLQFRYIDMFSHLPHAPILIRAMHIQASWKGLIQPSFSSRPFLPKIGRTGSFLPWAAIDDVLIITHHSYFSIYFYNLGSGQCCDLSW